MFITPPGVLSTPPRVAPSSQAIQHPLNSHMRGCGTRRRRGAPVIARTCVLATIQEI
jgi:hypothetical protein